MASRDKRFFLGTLTGARQERKSISVSPGTIRGRRDSPVDGEVDGGALGDVGVSVLADLGAEDDLHLAEGPPLLAVLDLGLNALVRLGRVQDRETLALERAREAVRAAGGDEPVQDGGLGDGGVRVGGRGRDRVRGVVQVEQVRVGTGDGDPRERVEARVAAMKGDCGLSFYVSMLSAPAMVGMGDLPPEAPPSWILAPDLNFVSPAGRRFA